MLDGKPEGAQNAPQAQKAAPQGNQPYGSGAGSFADFNDDIDF